LPCRDCRFDFGFGNPLFGSPSVTAITCTRRCATAIFEKPNGEKHIFPERKSIWIFQPHTFSRTFSGRQHLLDVFPLRTVSSSPAARKDPPNKTGAGNQFKSLLSVWSRHCDRARANWSARLFVSPMWQWTTSQIGKSQDSADTRRITLPVKLRYNLFILKSGQKLSESSSYTPNDELLRVLLTITLYGCFCLCVRVVTITVR